RAHLFGDGELFLGAFYRLEEHAAAVQAIGGDLFRRLKVMDLYPGLVVAKDAEGIVGGADDSAALSLDGPVALLHSLADCDEAGERRLVADDSGRDGSHARHDSPTAGGFAG